MVCWQKRRSSQVRGQRLNSASNVIPIYTADGPHKRRFTLHKTHMRPIIGMCARIVLSTANAHPTLLNAVCTQTYHALNTQNNVRACDESKI